MKINRANLLTILAAVKPGLASKDIVEQYVSFIFKGGRVYTYNEQVAISHPTECAFEGAVVAKEFYSILSKLKDAEIELVIEGGELRVAGKNSKAGVRVQFEIDLPFDEIHPTEWHVLSPDFAGAVNFASFCASKDTLDEILNCLHIKDDAVEACDRFRILKHSLKTPFDGEVLIPARAAAGLQTYDPTHFSMEQGWIHFKNKLDVIYSVRIGEGDYPSLDNYYVPGGIEVKLPSDTIEILERAKIFMPGETDADMNVELCFEVGKLTIRSQNEKGWFEECADIDYTADELTFQANPEFFRTMLPRVKSVHILNNDPSLPSSTGMVKFEGEAFIHSFTTVMGGLDKPEVKPAKSIKKKK